MSQRKKSGRVPEVPAGRIAHACAGRTRISFAAHKGDTATLTSLCDGVLGLPGVHLVEGRPATGSVIVSHEGTTEQLVEAAAAAHVFCAHELAAAQSDGSRQDGWQGMIEVAMNELGGSIGMARGGAALAFIAMAAVQASRGNVLPPATTALWYAASLLLGREMPSAGDIEDPGAHA